MEVKMPRISVDVSFKSEILFMLVSLKRYTNFEGYRVAPLDIGDRYIHPPSNIKRNLDFYLSYN